MKMYAIIDTGAEQLQVQSGRFYSVKNTLLPSSQTQSIQNSFIRGTLLLYRVLMIRYASQNVLGKPWIQGASMEVRLFRSYRDHKIVIYKMQPKKKTRRKIGYRHAVVRFIVDAINTSSH